MAGTIHQLWNLEPARTLEEEHDQCLHNNKRPHRNLDSLHPSQWLDNRPYPHFKHNVSKDSLRIDGRPIPSRTDAELKRRRMAPDAESCVNIEKSLYDKSPTAFVSVLRACSKYKDLHRGTRVHDDILQKGLLEECLDSLVTMYAKCGALGKAKELLDKHKSRNVSTWTALIAGYAHQGQGQDALICFQQMHRDGLSPNAGTFTCILKACGSIGATEKGEQIHEQIVRQGLPGNNIVLGTALVDMYAKCGVLVKAQQVFEELPYRDVIAWSALIVGYTQQGQGEQALKCFEQMQCDGLSPNAVTFSSILKACGSIGATELGEQIHHEIAKQGLLGNDIVVGSALVDMYAKCGALAKARVVLEQHPSRDVIIWSALIAGYAHQGQGEEALNCFERMQSEGLSPNAVTFACLLKACGSMGAADKGEQIHEEIARQGLLGNNIVLGSALVDMYAKCGALEKARRVLEELPSRDVITWSALIAGYAEQGQGEEALACFQQMRLEGLCPNAVTYMCILKACSKIGSTDKGEQIHDMITRQGLLGSSIELGTTLVDMYAKCGALTKAEKVLEELPSRDAVTWNALMAGYAQQGQGEQALNCFERMQHESFSPDAATFTCVLNACSHLGLVEDGHVYFSNMSTKFGVKPELEHYSCMVDLLGRAGHLDKAVGVIREMPSSDHSAVWSALLGACQKWGDVNVGRWAFEHAVKVDKSDSSAYVLMFNIYAAAGMQEEAKSIEAMRNANKAS